MTRKTAGKYLRQDIVMEQRQVPHTWRTRENPLKEMWPKAFEMLREAPELGELTPTQMAEVKSALRDLLGL